MKIIDIIISKDNMARKYLQKTNDGMIIETAYVDYYNKHIICYASQIGCKIGCRMCYNGINKNFYRNLTYEEIFEQCKNIIDDLKLEESNKPILFSCMGVGEPLLNYDNVVKAIKLLEVNFPNNKHALATTGVNLDLILDLKDSLKNVKNFKLTISLHGSNQNIRQELIPLYTKLESLVSIVKEFEKISKREVEWNYVLFDGINDKKENAEELVYLLGKGAKVKLNYYNKVEGCNLVMSKNYDLFIDILTSNGLYAECYQTNGGDIDGACGQMAGNRNL